MKLKEARQETEGECYMCLNSLDYLCKLNHARPDISLGAGRRLMERVIPKNVRTVLNSTNRAGHENVWVSKLSITALQHADTDGSAECRMRMIPALPVARITVKVIRCDVYKYATLLRPCVLFHSQ